MSLYNPSLYPRSDTVRFNIDFGFSEQVKYKGFLNGKPVKTYTQATYTITDLNFEKEPARGVIIFDLKDIPPLSTNFLNLEIDVECEEDHCIPAQ